MDYRNRQILIALIFLIALASMFYWITWGNRGVIHVSFLPPFSLSAEKYGRFECDQDPCIIRLPFGKRNFCIEKDGYYPICEEKNIIWRKDIIWTPKLQKKPYIIDAEVINIESETPLPSSLPPPPPKDPDIISIQGFSYNKKTGEVFRKDLFGKERLITRFYNLSDVSLLSSGKNVILYTPEEIFFINTKMRKKTRIFIGKNISVHKTGNDLFIVFHQDGIELLYPKTGNTAPLPFTSKPEHIVSCKNDFLRYATVTSDIISFFEYDIRSRKSTILTSAKITRDFTLQCGKNENEIQIHFPNGIDKIIRLK